MDGDRVNHFDGSTLEVLNWKLLYSDNVKLLLIVCCCVFLKKIMYNRASPSVSPFAVASILHRSRDRGVDARPLA